MTIDKEEPNRVEHFGLEIKKVKYSHRLVRDEFALINTKPSIGFSERLASIGAYTDESGSEYTQQWCEDYRKLCLQNFDLNMEYFRSLDKVDFNNAIETFLKAHRCFKKIDDLRDYAGVSGYYLMVLDEYKQVYIGKSDNIKNRIRRHWTNVKPFDTILFPMYAVNQSRFSIDFFRVLDTTRIYVWSRKLKIGIEDGLIEDFPEQFLTNRIGGDATNAFQAIATSKMRNLD